MIFWFRSCDDGREIVGGKPVLGQKAIVRAGKPFRAVRDHRNGRLAPPPAQVAIDLRMIRDEVRAPSHSPRFIDKEPHSCNRSPFCSPPLDAIHVYDEFLVM